MTTMRITSMMIPRLPNHWLTIGRKAQKREPPTEDNVKLIYLDMLAVELLRKTSILAGAPEKQRILSLRSGVNTRASSPSTAPITMIMTTDPKMVTPTMMTMFRRCRT